MNFFRFKKISYSLAFTLVELLVAVSISAILFVGVLVFVSSSMHQNIIQEKMLKSLTDRGAFFDEFSHVLGNTFSVVWSGATSDGTGILLRRNGGSPFVLLATESFTGICDTYSGSENASGTGTRLTIKTFLSPTLNHSGALGMALSQTGNIIYSGATTLIGTGNPGNVLTGSGETTELDTPSAIVGSGNTLYIADTLNDRILAYDTLSKSITELLGEKDGISLPIDLDFSGSSLLIANAGNGKILSIQDGIGDRGKFSQSFNVQEPFTFNRIIFEADTGSALSGSTNTDNYTFSGFTPGASDFIDASSAYVFSGSVYQSAATGTLYKITIDSITNTPSATGSHIMRLSFYSGTSLVYQDSFPWYTIGDGHLETIIGNVLQIEADSLDFPNNLSGDTWSGTIDYPTLISSTPLEYLKSEIPIENFSFSLSGKVLTLAWKEYSYYDCLTEKHKIQERVYKQLLQ